MLANFTKASLIVPETQAVARLLLEHPDAERWREAIEAENVLQAKTVNTAKSYARYGLPDRGSFGGTRRLTRCA